MNRGGSYLHELPDSLPRKRVCKGFEDEEMTLPLKFQGNWQLSQQASEYLENSRKVKTNEVKDKTISQCQIVPVHGITWLELIIHSLEHQMEV